MNAPAAVEEAIEAFDASDSVFSLVPPKQTEWSMIFKWGVRVKHESRGELGWICLGSQSCRDTWTFYPLHGGNTFNATRHLKEAHNSTAAKTQMEAERKRLLDEEIAHLKTLPMYCRDQDRLRLLVEARKIVFNNLPLRSGEYNDSRIINDLFIKKEFRVAINSKTIKHSIVELYSSAKKEVMWYLSQSRMEGVQCFTMVADFWTCSPQATKYLGVHVYFVDHKWDFTSILLGTRRFNSSYSERSKGIRDPFMRWLEEMVGDFGLSQSDFYAAITDGGSDIVWMMTQGLHSQWEWCVAHMTNAATKFAFGIEPSLNFLLRVAELLSFSCACRIIFLMENSSINAVVDILEELAIVDASEAVLEDEHDVVDRVDVVQS